MRRPRLSRGKRGCLAPLCLWRWFDRQPLNHHRTRWGAEKKQVSSESTIRSYRTAFLAEGGGLSRVVFWATCTALDSPPPGATLTGIGWPTVPHCRRPSERCRGLYAMVSSTGPTAGWRRIFCSPRSPLHHQASIRTPVSPEDWTRCTLVSGTFWGCTLPNGLGHGLSRQFQATKRSPQDRVMRETRETEASAPDNHSSINPRSPFSRWAPTPPLGLSPESGRLSLMQRLIDFAARPESVQQHRQFAGHRHHRPLLGILPTPAGQLQPPAPQVTVRTEGAQNVLGAPHQQPTQQLIPGFGDPQLRVLRSRFVSARMQPQKATYRAAVAKAMRIFQRQHIGQRGHRPHSLDLPQQFGLRIFLPAGLFNLAVIVLNLAGHRSQHLQQGLQGWTQRLRKLRPPFPGKAPGRARRHPPAQALDRSPHMVDQLRACCHHRIPCPDHRQIRLGLGSPMHDRRQQLRLYPPQPRQQFRIHRIILAVILSNQRQLARIRHQHFMPALGQQPAHPRRMRPRLDHHPRGFTIPKPLLQRALRRLHPSRLRVLSRIVQRVEVTIPVAQIDTNGHLRCRCKPKSVILCHGQSPFHWALKPVSFCWRPYRYSARLAFSYHLPILYPHN